VAGELTTEHLVRVLYEHPGGFRVLFAPGELSAEDRFDRATFVATVRALRERFGVTVVHLPRALDGAVRSVIELADIVLVVVSLDVVGIRMAKRLIDHLRSVGLAESMRLVINRAGRGEVVPQDAELVLETPIACVIGADRAVERAQNRGELIVERRGRLPRRIARLADQLLDGRAA
jgi:pilus assembly protein CpaE